VVAGAVAPGVVPGPPADAAERPRLAGEWRLTQRFQQVSDNTLPAGGATRTWRFKFVPGARVLLYAQKGTGGFRRVVLQWAGGRYVGVVKGRDLCPDGHYDRPGTASFRYSARVTEQRRAGGPPIATRIDAYYRATYRGCGTGIGHERIGWRGVRVDAPH
jgi:hypothetical protein